MDSKSWTGGESGHICNCIGCCPKCGSCITNPQHTADACEFLQKQAAERKEFFADR